MTKINLKLVSKFDLRICVLNHALSFEFKHLNMLDLWNYLQSTSFKFRKELWENMVELKF